MKRRRDVITLLGGAAVAWPLAARGQQPAMPMIGYFSNDLTVPRAFLDGLADTGFIAGRNVRIESRLTTDARQFPEIAADLVRSQVAVIYAGSSSAALAAKSATPTIPIVFGIGDDPVTLGLVTSLNRPGGNLTGITNNNVEPEGKRLAMMHRIVAADKTIAAMVDSNNPAAERQATNLEEAARSLGRKVRVLRVGNEREINSAFKTVVHENLSALFVAGSSYFATRRDQFVSLAAYEAIPAFYSRREFVEAGGLISYGADNNASRRQEGVYIGRILKGEQPANLPVVQATKLELVINLKTAKAIGLQFPAEILALADEVIE